MGGTVASGQDLQLWTDWNQGGRRPHDLEPLLDHLDPLIHSAVNQYAGKVNIPSEALQSKAEDLAIRGIRTFTPEKAQLSTHVAWQLRGLNRFVTTYQNVARIPQHQTHRIQELITTRDRMSSDLGRPPTDYALARKLHWSPRQVSSLQKGLSRRVLDPELFKLKDPRSFVPSRFNEVLRLLPSELGPRERFVFQSTYGLGKRQISAKQMATKLQTSQATISRMRKRVADVIARYMNVGGER
jgi:DNA-directed RNA polymerase specialized sigma subunit